MILQRGKGQMQWETERLAIWNTEHWKQSLGGKTKKQTLGNNGTLWDETKIRK